MLCTLINNWLDPRSKYIVCITYERRIGGSDVTVISTACDIQVSLCGEWADGIWQQKLARELLFKVNHIEYKKHNKKDGVKKTCIIKCVSGLNHAELHEQYNACFLWYWCYICNNLELFALLASMHCWLAVFLLHIGLRIKKKERNPFGFTSYYTYTLLFQAVSFMFPQPSVCHILAYRRPDSKWVHQTADGKGGWEGKTAQI